PFRGAPVRSGVAPHVVHASASARHGQATLALPDAGPADRRLLGRCASRPLSGISDPALLVPVRNRTRHGGCSTGAEPGADAVPGARVRLGLRTTHDIARPVPRNGSMRVDTGRHLRENTPEPGPSGPRERFAPAPPPLLALPNR